MIDFFRRLFAMNHQAKLERLVQQAAQIDELLMVGKISPDLRQRLQVARDKLEGQIQELLVIA